MNIVTHLLGTTARSMLILLIAGMMSVPCHARQLAGLEESLQPDFLKRDMAVLQTELKFDDVQRAIVESLFDDYDEKFRNESEEIREKMRTLSPLMGGRNPVIDRKSQDVRERLRQLMDEFRSRKQEGIDPEAQGEAVRNFREEMQKLQEELRSLNSGVNPSEGLTNAAYEDSAKAIALWQARKANLRTSFVDGVKATLNDSQIDHWPAVERVLRRTKTLPRGRLSGESVDLLVLFKQAGWMRPAEPMDGLEGVGEGAGEGVRGGVRGEPKTPLAQVLHEYEMQLDEVLRLRDEGLIKSQSAIMDAVRTADYSRIESLIDQHVQSRVAIRDVNDKFEAELVVALGEVDGAKLKDAYGTRGYPRVFRTTPAMRMVKAALELPGLEPEVQAALREVLTTHSAEETVANKNLLTAVKRAEPVELKRQLLSRMIRDEEWQPSAGDGNDPSDELADHYRNRQVLAERVMRQLRSILEPDQYQQLPGWEQDDDES